ncbi:hypothetical protein ES703_06520 [subsurface metagenome]
MATEEFKITEIGPLPQDWEVEPFDNVRVKAIGRIPPSIPVTGYQTQGKYPIIDQSANYIAGYTDDDSLILREQLPVIIFGDHTRIFKFVNFPFAIGADGTKIIYPNSDAYNPKFLYYHFLSLDIPSRGYNRHFRILREQKIARPPLPEQKRIAYFLSTVQTAIEKAEAVIRATRELKRSLMKHLFTYGPVSIAEAEKVPLKEAEIGLVPEGWEVVKLGMVCQKTRQTDARKSPNLEFCYIDVSSISRDTLRIVGYTRHSWANAPSRARKVMRQDDVIFATVRPYLKRFAMVPMEFDQQICSTAFCVIRANPALADSCYLFYAVSDDRFVQRVTGHQRGSNYPAVTDRNVLNELIPLPPLQAQRQIAGILSNLDSKIEAEENKKRALEALFKTLLSNLMTGKIRVNSLEVPV